MVLIAKAMMALVAPVLTYTIDEILDYAPAIIKGDMESVFDLVYEEIPKVEATFNDALLLEARDRLSELTDKLKKEKLIKSALELEIVGDITLFEIEDSKNLEDWFIVSGLKESSDGEEVGSFELDGKTFTIHKASLEKCPRCWRFVSDSEESACPRCAEVVA
jgi:isoleucyl-tRNA synthetase